MFQVTHINDVMILTPDVVQMNTAREQTIRNYTAKHGSTVGASIDTYIGGSIQSVDLFGGSIAQRQAFREGLTQALLG